MKLNELIDLTYDVEEGMTTFGKPWHPVVSVTRLGRIRMEGRETHSVSFGTHTGTHIDAPKHFLEKGRGVDEIPPETLIGPVTILDFSSLGEDGQVTKEMLEKCKISERVLFRFGWGKHWGTKRFYEGFPCFSMAAAEYLVSKKVILIGMDTPSPDGLGEGLDCPIHKLLLGQGVVLLEYLANLDKIKDLEGWTIAALPMKIKGVDGAPARVCIYK